MYEILVWNLFGYHRAITCGQTIEFPSKCLQLGLQALPTLDESYVLEQLMKVNSVALCQMTPSFSHFPHTRTRSFATVWRCRAYDLRLTDTTESDSSERLSTFLNLTPRPLRNTIYSLTTSYHSEERYPSPSSELADNRALTTPYPQPKEAPKNGLPHAQTPIPALFDSAVDPVLF